MAVIVPDMIGIVVADMGRSLAFYRLLGLPIADGQDNEPYAEVITPNGYRISWNTEAMVRQFDPAWETPVGQRISLAFKCESPASVNETYDAIVAAGYESHKAPWDAVWGQRYAMIRDPDGNTIDLFAPLSAA